MKFIVDKTKSINVQAFEFIKEAIIKFHFSPGQRISEKEISEKLNISRTPIREAFIRLSDMGLVKIYPQRGTFVSYINVRDVHEALFVRETLEVRALEQNINHFSEQNIELLGSIIAEQKKYHHEKNLEKFYYYDEKYHETLMKLSGYMNVWNIIQSSKAHLDRVRFLSLLYHIETNRLIKEHELVLNAIKRQEIEEAKRNLSEHIRSPIEEILEFIEQNHGEFFGRDE